MEALDLAYLVVSGAGSAASVVPALHAGLREHFPTVLTLLTPSAGRVIAPRDMARLAGARLVESYFDEAILPRPKRGLVLVAPCTFNSLNQLGAGLSPNLALSVTNEAIGRRLPVVVGVACNADLWAHPAARASARRLRRWGCHVVEPVPNATPSGLALAPVEAILAAVQAALART